MLEGLRRVKEKDTTIDSTNDQAKNEFRRPTTWADRLMLRTIYRLASIPLKGVEGKEILERVPEPAIFACNHNTVLDSFLMPPLMYKYRNWKTVRFLADWNFMLIPFASYIYYSGQAIPVVRKQAKPKFLTVFKKYLVKGQTGFELARNCLLNNCSIGIFPEGKLNPDPHQLMPGFTGAARLSLETGRPIVPIGVRFPGHDPKKKLHSFSNITVHFGEPLIPEVPTGEIEKSLVDEWHAQMMQAIAKLAQKKWVRRKDYGINKELVSRPGQIVQSSSALSEGD